MSKSNDIKYLPRMGHGNIIYQKQYCWGGDTFLTFSKSVAKPLLVETIFREIVKGNISKKFFENVYSINLTKLNFGNNYPIVHSFKIKYIL